MGQMQKVSGRATRITRDNDTIRIRYHDTDVVTFDDKTITLRTGGWKTVTTKARMNQTAREYGLGFTVYQKDFAWFVHTDFGTFLFTGHTLTLNRETMKPVTEKVD